jgi:hypothetical protein
MQLSPNLMWFNGLNVVHKSVEAGGYLILLINSQFQLFKILRTAHFGFLTPHLASPKKIEYNKPELVPIISKSYLVIIMKGPVFCSQLFDVYLYIFMKEGCLFCLFVPLRSPESW